MPSFHQNHTNINRVCHALWLPAVKMFNLIINIINNTCSNSEIDQIRSLFKIISSLFMKSYLVQSFNKNWMIKIMIMLWTYFNCLFKLGTRILLYTWRRNRWIKINSRLFSLHHLSEVDHRILVLCLVS